ncbi:MAG: cytochrome c1 [Rickettsiales bacterium]|nr:cytochrome c1 [Rickettsiales bacterium]
MLTKFLKISLLLLLTSNNVFAAGDAEALIKRIWQFEGVKGSIDKRSAQRGFQVYKEVCASCHSLKRVYFRNLAEIGFNEAEIKSLAATYQITDGPDESGDMYERAGRASDKFPMPYPNENAARAANGGAYPPDLSLIVKARPDGANYLYSLLNGYRNPPENLNLGDGMYYNIYYPGKQIAMPSPLSDGLVEYADNTNATIDQMSVDLVNFLQWTAEPEMEARNRMGIKVILFLIAFTILFYIAKKRIWSDVE